MEQEREFRGTAHDYTEFRPAYPQALIDSLLAEVETDTPRRLVDLGCGPGSKKLLLPIIATVCFPAIAPERNPILFGLYCLFADNATQLQDAHTCICTTQCTRQPVRTLLPPIGRQIEIFIVPSHFSTDQRSKSDIS